MENPADDLTNIGPKISIMIYTEELRVPSSFFFLSFSLSLKKGGPIKGSTLQKQLQLNLLKEN